MVTATCETDIDWASHGYYEPSVVCQLTDGDGNVLASGQYFDDSDDVSAVVVLQIQGIAGTNYIATGRHLALISIPLDNPDPQPGEPEEYYLDEYNISYFGDGYYTTYPDSYTWYGPGPETDTPAHVLLMGNTTGSGLRYYTPGELTQLITSAQSLFSSHCDAVFASVIGPSYTNINFFESLLATPIIQYPNAPPTDPPPYGPSTVADTLTNRDGRPIRIFKPFYPTKYGFTAGYQESVLTHEGIHHYTGWDDSTVTNSFGITPGSYGTEYISNWIARGCVNQ
jgi:hypothetical protein